MKERGGESDQAVIDRTGDWKEEGGEEEGRERNPMKRSREEGGGGENRLYDRSVVAKKSFLRPLVPEL